MAFAIADRVQETTVTQGTGTVVLAGAVIGYQSFAVIGNLNTTYYTIADQAGANWEVGVGTYYLANSSLARTTILSSSNSNAAVSFGVGTKAVFVTYPAEQAILADPSNVTTITNFVSSNVLITGGTISGANFTGLGTMASQNANAVAITGGSLNNVTIGSTTPNLATFTNVTATGNVISNGVSRQFVADFSNATVASRFTFTASAANANPGIYAVPSGIGTAASWQAANSSSITNASKILIASNGTTDVQLVSGINGSGTYLPLAIWNNGSEKMRVAVSGNVGIGNTNPQSLLTVAGQIEATATGYKFPDGTTQTTAAGDSVGLGNSSILALNVNITANATINAGVNGFSVGPVNTANGVVVTITSGQRWVII